MLQREFRRWLKLQLENILEKTMKINIIGMHDMVGIDMTQGLLCLYMVS